MIYNFLKRNKKIEVVNSFMNLIKNLTNRLYDFKVLKKNSYDLKVIN